MMLYPSMASLLKRVNSRYMLVNAIAKRSRDLAEDAIHNDEHLEKKPVSIAIDEIASGEFNVIPHSHKED